MLFREYLLLNYLLWKKTFLFDSDLMNFCECLFKNCNPVSDDFDDINIFVVQFEYTS